MLGMGRVESSVWCDVKVLVNILDGSMCGLPGIENRFGFSVMKMRLSSFSS